MSMPQPVTYQVTAVSPDQQQNAAGDLVPGKTLTFSTSTGYTGTIFIPQTIVANVPVVQQMIEAEVQQVVAAQNISGTISPGG